MYRISIQSKLVLESFGHSTRTICKLFYFKNYIPKIMFKKGTLSPSLKFKAYPSVGVIVMEPTVNSEVSESEM